MRPLVILLFAAASLPAAPVPKSLKKPPSADGVWEFVEYNSDGRSRDVPERARYWRIDGERMSNGRATLAEIAKPMSELHPFTLRIDDPAQPTRRTMLTADGNTFPAVVELDGDTLRWVWSTDPAKSTIECKPGLDMEYSVFRRVKEK